MQIDNIRFGFACNSSSTHSFILFPKKVGAIKDKNVPKDQMYEWENFTLASKKAKLGYIGTILKLALEKNGGCPKYIWDYYQKEWLDGAVIDIDGNIDHGSKISLPKYFDVPFVNKEFFDELKAHLLQENLVIFGGNDNDEYFANKLIENNHGECTVAQRLRERTCEIARKDPKYGYWVLFDQRDGAKIRMSFDGRDTKRSSLPELVDLKITDYCDKGCTYCYQNSSKEGKHADYHDIYAILDALEDMQVLEIALGGGCPTHHPDFHRILREVKGRGIVPNFTTRNYNWFNA